MTAPPSNAVAIRSTPVDVSRGTSTRWSRPDDHSVFSAGASAPPSWAVAMMRRDGVASTQSASRAGSSTTWMSSTTATSASGSNVAGARRGQSTTAPSASPTSVATA